MQQLANLTSSSLYKLQYQYTTDKRDEGIQHLLVGIMQ